jgi:hypothetical protein
MKKNLLFAAFLTVLVIFSLCFAAVKLPEPKLLGISIIGPDSVPADTQNVWNVIANFDNGSEAEVTANADVMVYPDELAVIDLGAIIETFKQTSDKEQFTIRARYQDFTVEKVVTIYRSDDNQ